MRITRLKVNHLSDPIGIAVEPIILSYQVEDSVGAWCVASRIEIENTFDTGWLDSRFDEHMPGYVPALDPAGWRVPVSLAGRTAYRWRVWVKTDAGECDCSDWHVFETAKAPDEPWQAHWITNPASLNGHPVFSTRFSVSRPVESARLYGIGLGLYELYLNGEKVGDEVLSPGFHTYDAALQYQTWTLCPHEGENDLAFLLGEGWYMGRYGLNNGAPKYGDHYALFAELHVRYADGSEEVFGTDEGWQTWESPILMDSIYDGETFDARRLAAASAGHAVLCAPPAVPLIPRMGCPIRVHERFPGTPLGNGLYDFGQNLAGWVEFDCDAPAGAEIHITFGELVREGRLYRDNLRRAKAEFNYISDGSPRRVRAHFTFYGFRYAQVEGEGCSRLTACAIYSDMERTGWLETDHPLLNQLFSNQLWSQKSNFLDVPTDCPQRNERMGWTGDIQVFSDTACFNMDCTAFLRKYLFDLANDQARLNGCVPMVSPMAGYELRGCSGWGDAATVVPWMAYLHSGDKALLQQALPGMTAWVDYITYETRAYQSGCLWSGTPQLGDWLALDGDSVHGGTDRVFIASAYYFLSASITAKAAAVLGKAETASAYSELARNIRAAMIQEYVTPSGKLAVDTQTAHVMALYLHLLPDDASHARSAKRLREIIAENGGKLQTGFLGTVWLLSALSDSGSADVAYDLLLREAYPGWLNEVRQGATTIWERWNSIEPDGSMNRDGMNSLNHYAYGSVAGWMYRVMGGLHPVESHPGFRVIHLLPQPDRRIGYCRARLLSPHGWYETHWHWQGDELLLKVTVPFGCVARLQLGELAQTLTMGEHHLRVALPRKQGSLREAPLETLLSRPETREVFAQRFPRALRGVAFQYEMHTLGQLLDSPFSNLTKQETELLLQELAQRCK